MGNEIKVIHLPTMVGGNPQGISRHLNLLGFKSDTLATEKSGFGYNSDRILSSKNSSLFILEIRKLCALSYVLFYDVVFFNFGSTLFKPGPYDPVWNKSHLKRLLYKTWFLYTRIMQRVELSLLRACGRICLIQYQGDDARQGDFCRQNFMISLTDTVDTTYYSEVRDEWKRKQIRLMSRYCHRIYSLNPDLLHVLPERAEFLPYCHISLDEWLPNYTQLEEKNLRIGHAPSNRKTKGTDLIVSVVEKLKTEGYNFEFVLVEGHTNAEAKRIYESVDVFIDQIYAGWYGALSVEVMALGKPVVVYIRDEDLKYIPMEMKMDMPFFNTMPNNLEQTLIGILEMPRRELYEIAKKSRLYVEKWHNPLIVADRLKKDIEKLHL